MPEEFVVHLTLQAEDNYKGIIRYLSENLGNYFAAIKFDERFWKKLESLKYSPGGYGLVEQKPYREKGVRKVHIKGYNIYFVVDPVRKQVSILAVAHAKMALKNALRKG